MRRKCDKLVVTCTAISILCAMVTVVFVAPTVLHLRDLTERINDERRRNSERNCLDVNARHDRTIAAVDSILAQRLRVAGPAERVRLQASRQTTVLLVNSLTPKRDCAAYAESQVKTNP